jgi:broad specificity phosphatase PhoE
MFLKTNIFLVRHGETEWNRQSRLQGSQNSALTPSGVQQAHQVKKSLEPYSIDFAYVSPLQRARDTIEIILKDRNLEEVIVENLREINLGPWEGKTRKETELSHPDEYRAFWQKSELFNLPGAETYLELQERVVEELESIFLKGKNKNSLIVSHWIAIKVALAHYTSTSLSDLSSISDPVNGAFLCLSKRGSVVSIHQ